MELEDYITSIPDFPKAGIIFRDITTVFSDKDGLHLAIDSMQDKIKHLDFDIIVGAESRGFLFGVPIAYNLNKPFVMARKKGKLPREVIAEDYNLEYGTACLELHIDSIKKGQRVLIIDDLLATGGTAKAIGNLVERLGGVVAGYLFLIELDGLGGRDKLISDDVYSCLKFEEE